MPDFVVSSNVDAFLRGATFAALREILTLGNVENTALSTWAGSINITTIGAITGTPSLPTGTIGVTQSAGNSTTALATTAFVTAADNLKANLASPTFTGVPLSTTAAVDTNTTQIATTAYVIGQAYAKLASPAFSGTPSLPTGTTGVTQSPGNNTTALATTAFVAALGALKANLASPTFTGTVTLPTGGSGAAPMLFVSGTNLSSVVAGAQEFDGTAYYQCVDTTSGRAQKFATHIFRLAANLGTRGPAIADFFDASSAFPTVLNGVYELIWDLYFTKTTDGTVTWTITNTQTFTNIAASYRQSAVGGLGTNAAITEGGVITQTGAATALPVTGTVLAAGVGHHVVIRAIAECGTAGNIRLRITQGSGTVTPLRGSMFTARRLFAGNVGTFAA